jgi:hypothetical protein
MGALTHLLTPGSPAYSGSVVFRPAARLKVIRALLWARVTASRLVSCTPAPIVYTSSGDRTLVIAVASGVLGSLRK